MAEIQNSNPTILDAADLPTRLRTKSGKSGKSGKAGEYGLFTTVPLPVDFESASSDSDGETLEEPIDEQEIYGQSDCLSHFLTPRTSLNDSRSYLIHLRSRTPYLAR